MTFPNRWLWLAQHSRRCKGELGSAAHDSAQEVEKKTWQRGCLANNMNAQLAFFFLFYGVGARHTAALGASSLTSGR